MEAGYMITGVKNRRTKIVGKNRFSKLITARTTAINKVDCPTKEV
jgi:hypothetical protein